MVAASKCHNVAHMVSLISAASEYREDYLEMEKENPPLILVVNAR